MNAPDPSRRYLNSPAPVRPPRQTQTVSSLPPPGHERPGFRAALIVGVAAFVLLVQAFHLNRLGATRRAARVELSQTLHDPGMLPEQRIAALVDAFDRSTQDILFAASGPYLILAVAVLFLTAQATRLRLRLSVVERILVNRTSERL